MRGGSGYQGARRARFAENHEHRGPGLPQLNGHGRRQLEYEDRLAAGLLDLQEVEGMGRRRDSLQGRHGGVPFKLTAGPEAPSEPRLGQGDPGRTAGTRHRDAPGPAGVVEAHRQAALVGQDGYAFDASRNGRRRTYGPRRQRQH